MKAYRGSQDRASDLLLEGSAVGPAVQSLMKYQHGWQGTADELSDELSKDQHTSQETRWRKDWPTTPSSLSKALRRLAPNFRKVGIEIRFDDRSTDSSRRRIITVVRKPETEGVDGNVGQEQVSPVRENLPF